jgi:hypothetical protein
MHSEKYITQKIEETINLINIDSSNFFEIVKHINTYTNFNLFLINIKYKKIKNICHYDDAHYHRSFINNKYLIEITEKELNI